MFFYETTNTDTILLTSDDVFSVALIVVKSILIGTCDFNQVPLFPELESTKWPISLCGGSSSLLFSLVFIPGVKEIQKFRRGEGTEATPL